jgi:glucose/arabinose dehydrogenase
MITRKLPPAAVLLLTAALALASCEGQAAGDSLASHAASQVSVTEIARFDQPWAIAFIPGTPLALVTEKGGRLMLWEDGGEVRAVTGAPTVDYGGQGGLGDVLVSPRFATDRLIYLSWAEAGPGDTRGAVVGRARLDLGGIAALGPMEILWTQDKTGGRGHYSHRLAFSPDGASLYIASGDRQKLAPAQNPQSNLGKIVRIDISDPHNAGDIVHTVSMGHRNILGLKFDDQGRLWSLEHGPAGGDELNLVREGANYGWPVVSEGNHYSGTAIPRHASQPHFAGPAISWTPVIAPGDFIFCRHCEFSGWQGQALIAGMKSKAISRIAIEGDKAREGERIAMGARIRSIAQRDNGEVWVLTDGSPGKLLRLRPATAAAER